MAGPPAAPDTAPDADPEVLLLCRLFDDLWLFGVSLEVETPRSRLPGELAECCEVESELCLLVPPCDRPLLSCRALLPLGPLPPPPPLPFSTSHSLCPSGGLPLAARAPCSSNRLSEKSKLNEFRLVRRIFAYCSLRQRSSKTIPTQAHCYHSRFAHTAHFRRSKTNQSTLCCHNTCQHTEWEAALVPLSS